MKKSVNVGSSARIVTGYTPTKKNISETKQAEATAVLKECKHERQEVRNYSAIWHDGDIHCVDCGKFIRYYDAG